MNSQILENGVSWTPNFSFSTVHRVSYYNKSAPNTANVINFLEMVKSEVTHIIRLVTTTTATV